MLGFGLGLDGASHVAGCVAQHLLVPVTILRRQQPWRRYAFY